MLRRCSGSPTFTVLVVVVALGAAACDSNREPAATVAPERATTPEPSLPADDPPDERAPFVAPTRDTCRHDRLETATTVTLTDHDPVELAARIAHHTHRCTQIAVVAPIERWAATLAVPVALARDAPLLLVDPDDPTTIEEVLERLDVDEIVTVGIELDVFTYPGTALVVPDTTLDPTVDGSPENAPDSEDEEETAALHPDGHPNALDDELLQAEEDTQLALIVAAHLDVDRFVAVREDDVRGRTAAAIRTDGSRALLPIPEDNARITSLAESLPASAQVDVIGGPAGRELADALLSVGIDAALVEGDRWPTGSTTVWLVDPDQPDAGAVTAVAAGGRSETVLPIDGTDLRADVNMTARIRRAEPERTVLVGAITDDAGWQLELVRDGATLPAGGFRLFEEERIVALYGSPTFPALGALGEQDLDATVERLREVAAPYAADGARVLPAFEVITTIASASPQDTGDYSQRTDIDDIRPYVDRAAVEGFYVILDLQPGRTGFLEQAQEYEELLLEPHVGLALDPEWRIGPDEIHLQRIGDVEVEEVQEVADWLAELTRENNLPQKLLLLHQFTLGMLPDRDQLVVPPELSVVVHMDGQGALTTKYDTYAAITRGAEDRWVWGWKNFYSEDTPVAAPDQVLDLDPSPMLVTYQ